jgi:hypothetical protein
MSEARAITNLIGNTVATIAIARWDGALDVERCRRVLDGEAPRDEPGEAGVSVVAPGFAPLTETTVSTEPWPTAQTHTTM